jgi:hypothetical protein
MRERRPRLKEIPLDTSSATFARFPHFQLVQSSTIHTQFKKSERGESSGVQKEKIMAFSLLNSYLDTTIRNTKKHVKNNVHA